MIQLMDADTASASIKDVCVRGVPGRRKPGTEVSGVVVGVGSHTPPVPVNASLF